MCDVPFKSAASRSTALRTLTWRKPTSRRLFRDLFKLCGEQTGSMRDPLYLLFNVFFYFWRGGGLDLHQDTHSESEKLQKCSNMSFLTMLRSPFKNKSRIQNPDKNAAHYRLCNNLRPNTWWRHEGLSFCIWKLSLQRLIHKSHVSIFSQEPKNSNKTCSQNSPRSQLHRHTTKTQFWQLIQLKAPHDGLPILSFKLLQVYFHAFLAWPETSGCKTGTVWQDITSKNFGMLYFGKWLMLKYSWFLVNRLKHEANCNGTVSSAVVNMYSPPSLCASSSARRVRVGPVFFSMCRLSQTNLFCDHGISFHRYIHAAQLDLKVTLRDLLTTRPPGWCQKLQLSTDKAEIFVTDSQHISRKILPSLGLST